MEMEFRRKSRCKTKHRHQSISPKSNYFYLGWKGNVHSHYTCLILLMISGYNQPKGEITIIAADLG